MKRNPKLGSGAVRAKKRRLFWIRFSLILFFLLVIVFGLAIASGQPKIKIQTVLISGNAAASTEQILQIVNRDLAGRYLQLFARSNSLIFPRYKIVADLLAEIKIIKAVRIDWQDWQTINILIEERKPHAVWCGSALKNSDQICYFIDKDGFIFNQASVFSGRLFVRFYRPLLVADPIGQTFLPTAKYTELFALIDSLNKNNLFVQAVVFDGPDFNFVLESGPTIIFNDKEKDLALVFEKLFTAMATGDLDLLGEGNKINYVDLRFGDKIVVGKKGE